MHGDCVDVFCGGNLDPVVLSTGDGFAVAGEGVGPDVSSNPQRFLVAFGAGV